MEQNNKRLKSSAINEASCEPFRFLIGEHLIINKFVGFFVCLVLSPLSSSDYHYFYHYHYWYLFFLFLVSKSNQMQIKRKRMRVVVKQGNKTRLKCCFLRYSYSTSVLDRSHNHANKAAEHYFFLSFFLLFFLLFLNYYYHYHYYFEVWRTVFLLFNF